MFRLAVAVSTLICTSAAFALDNGNYVCHDKTSKTNFKLAKVTAEGVAAVMSRYAGGGGNGRWSNPLKIEQRKTGCLGCFIVEARGGPAGPNQRFQFATRWAKSEKLLKVKMTSMSPRETSWSAWSDLNCTFSAD